MMTFLSICSCSSKRSVLDSQMFTGAPIPSTFFIGGDISTDLIYASLASPDSEIFKGASLMGGGVGAEIVIGWPKFFIGGGADYSKLYQLETVSDLDDKNTSGTLMTGFGEVGFYLKRWRFTLKYLFTSTYTFDQKSLGGKEFILSKPVSSFGLNATIGGNFSLDINSINYGEYSLEGTKNDFKESVRPKILTYGVMYAIRF